MSLLRFVYGVKLLVRCASILLQCLFNVVSLFVLLLMVSDAGFRCFYNICSICIQFVFNICSILFNTFQWFSRLFDVSIVLPWLFVALLVVFVLFFVFAKVSKLFVSITWIV